MKLQKNFRFDPLAYERLKGMAEENGMSQADLLEELVNACFDAACLGYSIEAFQRFADRMKERQMIRQKGAQ